MRQSKSLNNLSSFSVSKSKKSVDCCFIPPHRIKPQRPTANFEEPPPSCFIWYGYCPVSVTKYPDVTLYCPLRA